jgi:Flp pilus assembly protein TadD
VPGADAYLGLAACQVARGARDLALGTLGRADTVEPGNPVVSANLGLLEEQRGRVEAAVAALRKALEIEPDFHQARFNLALVYARAGRRTEARQTAGDLLGRLPATSPQRAEVERLLAALR